MTPPLTAATPTLATTPVVPPGRHAAPEDFGPPVVASATSASASRSGAGRVPALLVAALIIGVGNYAMSWFAVHLMPAEQFARYAAAQGLLLVLGTGSVAAVPWAVARFVALHGDEREQSAGLHFGLVAAAVQAAVVGPVAFVITWVVVDLPVGLATGAGAALISLLAAPGGWFQGRLDIRGLVALRCIEAGVRIGAAVVVLTTVSTSAVPAVGSFALGAAVAVGYGLWRTRGVFPLVRIGRRAGLNLVRQALALGGVQVLLAALGALDTVYVAAAGLPVHDEASYQAAALVARIPLFFSSAISVAAFARLAAARSDDDARPVLAGALRSYWLLAVPVALVCLTVPGSLLHRFIPSDYGSTVEVLRLVGITGILVGAVNVVTTAHQARLRYVRCLVVLAGAVLAQAVALLLAGASGSVLTFAAAGLGVLVLATVAVTWDARRWLARPSFQVSVWWLPVVVGTVAAAAFRGTPVVWCGAVAVVGVTAALLAFRGPSGPTSPSPRSIETQETQS